MPSANEFILMKASRCPSAGIAEVHHAYNQVVYDNLPDAISAAEYLTTFNPIGFRVWEIGSDSPLCSTVESWYKNQVVPMVNDFKKPI